MKKIDGKIYWYMDMGALIIDHCDKCKMEKELGINMPDEIWNEMDVQRWFTDNTKHEGIDLIKLLLSKQEIGENYDYVVQQLDMKCPYYIIAKVRQII
jgi:hypothetical protein